MKREQFSVEQIVAVLKQAEDPRTTDSNLAGARRLRGGRDIPAAKVASAPASAQLRDDPVQPVYATEQL